MTLVEVVTGLALLATLLVAVLIGFRAQSVQYRSARDRLEALEAADRLLSEWAQEDVLPAVGREEQIPGDAGLRWRMVETPVSSTGESAPRTMRLEVIRSETEPPLASVELLVESGGKPSE